jgi:hypothetical protein
MKYLVKVWRMAEGNDRSALQGEIEWHDFHGLHGFYSGGEGTGFARYWTPWPPPHSIRIKRNDVIAAARSVLTNRINEVLVGTIDAGLIASPRGGRPSLHMVPKDLLAGLWLQFARAVAGGKEYSRCEQCGSWFEISSPEGGRVDKRYCSTACRARKWRAQRDNLSHAKLVPNAVGDAPRIRFRK